MVYLIQTTLLGLMLIGLSACGGKPVNGRGLEVSSSFLVASNFTGGGIVRVENPATSTFTDYDLANPPFVVAIPDGTWNIYFVGVLPDNTARCGGVLNLNLSSTTTAIDIIATQATCTSAPYSTLVTKKIATWDVALWDQAKWGP